MDADKYRPRDRAYDPEPIAATTSRSTLVIAGLLLVACLAAGWLLYSGGVVSSTEVTEITEPPASPDAPVSSSVLVEQGSSPQQYLQKTGQKGAVQGQRAALGVVRGRK